MCPYNQTDTKIHSFIGTHQPAIWMGESGPVQVMAGHGEVETDFDKRALPFKRENEYASVNYYSNVLALNKEDNIGVELSAGKWDGVYLPQRRGSAICASRFPHTPRHRDTLSSMPVAPRL